MTDMPPPPPHVTPGFEPAPEPPKPTFSLDMWRLIHGGIVVDAEQARRMGELYIEILYGPEALEQHRPLSVVQDGELWWATGRWIIPPEPPGGVYVFAPKHRFEMILWRPDGRVLHIADASREHPQDPTEFLRRILNDRE